jgi:glutathione S-transferase
MADLTLYIGNKNYSSWSLRAWLAAKLSGLPFRETSLDISDPVKREPIRRVSPSGRVPVLHDGDLAVWDSLAIAEYLAEKAPHAGLWPSDSAARAVARSACAEMHSSFTALRTHMPMNIRRSAPGRGRGEGVADDIARITALWRDCRSRYGSGGPYLFGRLGLADAFFAPVLTRLRTNGVELDAESAAYCETVWSWPALREWAAAAAAEKAAIAKYDEV